jgi:hypothetical protein
MGQNGDRPGVPPPPGGDTAPGRLFTVRATDGVLDGPVGDVLAVEACVVLHRWRDAATTLGLLDLVRSPATVRPHAAALHAARMLEADAPGSAAMCGLARALLLTPSHAAATVRDVVRAVHAARHPSRRVDRDQALALGAVEVMASRTPDDLAVLAPLFLDVALLAPEARLDLQDGVPALVLTGRVELSVRPECAVVVDGAPHGDGTGVDVARLTAAFRAAPPAPAGGRRGAAPVLAGNA